MKKLILTGIIIALIIGGIWWFKTKPVEIYQLMIVSSPVPATQSVPVSEITAPSTSPSPQVFPSCQDLCLGRWCMRRPCRD